MERQLLRMIDKRQGGSSSGPVQLAVFGATGTASTCPTACYILDGVVIATSHPQALPEYFQAVVYNVGIVVHRAVNFTKKVLFSQNPSSQPP